MTHQLFSILKNDRRTDTENTISHGTNQRLIKPLEPFRMERTCSDENLAKRSKKEKKDFSN